MKENKILITDFVHGNRFELNSYLTYLFSEVKMMGQGQIVDKKGRQIKAHKMVN